MIKKYIVRFSLIIGFGLFFSASGFTAQPEPAQTVNTSATSSKGLQKNLSFEDLLVQGKYQFSDESVVTVEQDKILDSLLGVRKDFQDRIKQSATRY